MLAIIFLVGCQQGTQEDPLLSQVKASHDLGKHWLLSNIKESGIFRYTYHPKTNEYPEKNNALRQLMAARLLAELSAEDSSLQSMHRKNLEFYIRHWYRERDDGVGYVYYNEKSKLGANAMLLRTFVASPFYEEYKEKAAATAKGILFLMNEDGSFNPWFIAPSYKYDTDHLLTFYSGEAILALVEYYAKEPSEDLLNAITLAQEYYVDRYVTHLEQNYYPAYVPWHTLSLNKLWKIQPKQEYRDAIFVLNDKLLEILDRTQYIGRFYNPQTPEYGTPHSSSDGVYTEGLVYAYEIAVLTGSKDHQQRYAEALKLALPNLFSLQYNEETASVYQRPDRAIGGLKYSVDHSGIRIDTVQHTLDAYRKLMQLHHAGMPFFSLN